MQPWSQHLAAYMILLRRSQHSLDQVQYVNDDATKGRQILWDHYNPSMNLLNLLSMHPTKNKQTKHPTVHRNAFGLFHHPPPMLYNRY